MIESFTIDINRVLPHACWSFSKIGAAGADNDKEDAMMGETHMI